MEPGFFARNDEAACIALSLERAQSALNRADSCDEATVKRLYLSLAECWREIAQQFERLSALRSPKSPIGSVEDKRLPVHSVRALTRPNFTT